MHMATFISHSVADTVALGESWGRAAQSGWVIGLSGDLGAGKTHLVKGIAKGLGVTGRIHSPTFALINEYSEGRLPLFHLDLYRLENREQIIAAGLEEYFYQRRGVTIVEWIERWTGSNPGREKELNVSGSLWRRAQIEIINETDRRITYEDFGC